MTTTQLATLPPVERAIAALSFETVRAEVSKLATQYADITAISNKAGRDQAHAAAMTLKNRRVEIQRRAKEVREDAVAFQKAVIAKGDELAALIEPEEQRLLKLRDAWDAEQERIKREAAEAEQRRKQGHEAKIADIRSVVVDSSGKSALCLQHIISGLEMEDVSEASFEEYAPVASRAKAETLDKLRAMKAEAEAREAEQARIKAEQEAEAKRLAAEREELARLRAEADERQRIADEQAAEARRVEEAKMAEERAAIARQREQQEAENLARQMELDRQAAEIRAQQEAARKAQEAAAEAERARIAAAEAEAARQAEAKARAEREEAERIAEAKRAEAAAELERQMKEQAEAAHLAREGQIPLRSEIIDVIAGRYDVSPDAAERWLVELFAVEVA